VIWRSWSFLAGAPVGPLALLALGSRAPDAWLLVSAGLAGALLLACIWLVARARDDDAARTAHLACAAGAGLVSLPALVACGLALWPGAALWLVLQLLLLSGAIVWAARLHAPSGGVWRQLRAALSWLLVGAAAALGLGIGSAALQGAGPERTDARARAILDADALIPTRALPVCGEAPARVRVLLDRGARPRLDPTGEALWFDAPVSDRRQVHRLVLATGDVQCWTCDEPGNNLRPAPGALGLVFETDRHASWRDPSNTELHFVQRPGEAPRGPSRRITRAPGPDAHALIDPTAARVVWSRRPRAAFGVGYEVVWASLQTAHGALQLGGVSTLARAGSRWLAPLAWSPDARSLVLLEGNPFAPARAFSVDFAGGEPEELARDAGRGGAAFSADGGVLALAGVRRGRVAGLLPAPVAALFAPLAGRLEGRAPLYREAHPRIAADGGPLRELPASPDLAWGSATGLSLSPDGTTLYLGQQRDGDGERLLEIRRDCR